MYQVVTTCAASHQSVLTRDSDLTLSVIIFFIAPRRASMSSNIDGVCVVINNACAVLETELCSSLMHTMKIGFPSGYIDLTQAYNVMIQGRLQTTDAEQSKAIFIVSIGWSLCPFPSQQEALGHKRHHL